MNILFDLDGTLTDSKSGILSCIKHALSALEVSTPSDSVLESFIGASLRDVFKSLLPEGCTATEIEHAVSLYRERFKTKGLFENSVYAGIPSALEGLKNQGTTLYLATSKPRIYAEQILHHFNLSKFFNKVYGSELDGRYDLKSELILHALEDSGISKHNTLMVGDRLHDIHGAIDNQIFPVGVLWGYGSENELISAGAEMLCSSPEELPGLLSTKG